MARTYFTILNGFELGGGDVYQDVAGAEVQGVFAYTGIVFAQSLEPGTGRDIEFGAGAFIDLARGCNAVTALEGLKRFRDIGVKNFWCFNKEIIEGQIAFGHQALTQHGDQIAFRAFFKLALADAGPAAAGNDFLIHLDGAFKGAD